LQKSTAKNYKNLSVFALVRAISLPYKIERNENNLLEVLEKDRFKVRIKKVKTNTKRNKNYKSWKLKLK
jgi:hypothetical protein